MHHLFTLLLLTFSALILAAPEKLQIVGRATLEVRQRTGPPAPPAQCIDYEKTANLSVVGTNTSYRSVFMQKSGTGYMYDDKMFMAAQAKLPGLTADKRLNTLCGNKTKAALDGAEFNLTKGIVAQFTTEGLTPINGGYAVLFCTFIGIAILVGTWLGAQ